MEKLSVLVRPELEGDPFYWQAGPTGVLLSHGFTATSAEVRPLAKLLHAQGYTVAGPLLAGHGTTPEDLNRVRWQDWLASVTATYQELARNCTRVIVGGESTGALLALYLASQVPEIAGVLAYAPALKLQISRSNQIKLRLLAPFIASVPKGGPKDDNPWQGYAVNPLKGTLQLLRLQKALRPRLPAIHQPALLAQGRLDGTVTADAPQIIHDEISSAVKELHWFEHSAHCMILEKELPQITEVTLRFIRNIESQSISAPQKNNPEVTA